MPDYRLIRSTRSARGQSFRFLLTKLLRLSVDASIYFIPVLFKNALESIELIKKNKMPGARETRIETRTTLLRRAG